MKFKVYVTLKETILDPQGRAVQQAIHTMGFPEVSGLRIGKFIELELESQPLETAKNRVEEMCEKLLANTVIEEYRIEAV